MSIQHVAVIGAGVMGRGIAAHMANAGVEVTLLDIVPEDAKDRNVMANSAVQALMKEKPAALMHRRLAKRIRTGNLSDDLERLAEADWIIEVVVERLDIKQRLYRQIESVRKPGSIVSSNTSTLPLVQLTEGMPESFCQDFLITHFFNPPRYMRLLELVAGPSTRADAVDALAAFCDHRLGKGVVQCNDTPGFIANRIGIYWLQTAIAESLRLGLTVEEADAISGRPMGIPKTGVFGLLDLVGLDLMPHVMASMLKLLPTDDALHANADIPSVVEGMIEQGYTGRKGKGGFYRLNRSGGQKIKESIDLNTGDYAASQKPKLASLQPSTAKNLRALMQHPDKGGQFAWAMLSKLLHYTASLVPEISDDPAAIDRAMQLGYNWRLGPFELMDQIGNDWLIQRYTEDGQLIPALLASTEGRPFYRLGKKGREVLRADGEYHPVTLPEGVIWLSEIKRFHKPIAKNASASLWDIGDGVVCLEFHSKMNALDRDILLMIRKAVEIMPDHYRALVLYNEGENYSVGANLGLGLFAANIAAWPQIEELVQFGQETFRLLKYAPFPVVGAPANMALGGGCETLLHCDAIQAHAETYMGLVEVGVGLLPAWGGSKEILSRWQAFKKRPQGPMPGIAKAFEIVSTASVSTSAFEAKDLLYLAAEDGISMNRDRLLADAKAKAIALAHDYTPPEPPEFQLPGETARIAMKLAVDSFKLAGKASEHDAVVADQLAFVFSGGDTDMLDTLSEDDLLALERKAFMRLIPLEKTLARVEHTLLTGKPLRN